MNVKKENQEMFVKRNIQSIFNFDNTSDSLAFLYKSITFVID